ncbi:MAG: EAL domain-containing protein [Shewanella sp.]
MLVALHHLNFKQKLILLSLLPLCMLIIFVLIRMSTLVKDYQATSHQHLAIQITVDITELIHELQNEYTLSSRYRHTSTPEDETALNEQQANTSALLNQLLTSPALTTLLSSANDKHYNLVTLQERLDTLTSTANHLLSARQDIALRPEVLPQPEAMRHTALNRHSEAFVGLYYQLNTQLLGLLQLLQQQTNDIKQFRSYSDLANLLKLQEIAVKERNLIYQTLLAGSINIDDYRSISTVMYEYGQAELHASHNAISDKQSLIRQIPSSLESLQIAQISQQVERQLRISALAQEIKIDLGYSGLIHSFQHYLQHTSPQSLNSFQQALAGIRSNLDALSLEPQKLPEQREALNAIKTSINEYELLMANAKQFKKHASTIDIRKFADLQHRANANDLKLIAALETLLTPPPINHQQWWTLTTERINRLCSIIHDITQSMAEQSDRRQTHALSLLGFYLCTVLLTMALTLWLGRKIIRSFVNKISQIANDMQQMAANPKLNINFDASGSDELASMASAMNRMINEREKANQALNLAAAVFDYSAEGIIVTDADNHIELVNPAFTQITGYSLSEVKGRNPSILNSKRQQEYFFAALWETLLREGKWEGEIWNKRKNGEVYPEYLAITVVRNEQGQIIQHIGLFMDISKRKQYEQDLWYQANFDPLTGLPNRKLFNERLQHEIQLTQHDPRKLAILLIDLDQFKYINDLQGHSIGDLLLQDVAKRLESLASNNDFIARIGGDEFVLILPRITNELAIEHMATRIMDTLAVPFTLNHREIQISVSFGIGIYPDDGLDASSLTRNTEMAMYQAKDAGRNNFKYFTAGMNQAMYARMELEQRLRRAVAQHEFTLHYQPIVAMNTGKVCTVEALIRWQDPDLGLIPPDHFIGIAEETGLIEPMGEWVLNQAMKDLRQWQQSGIDINVAINISSRQCINTRGMRFDQVLQECFHQHHINPQKVHIEITESMLMADASDCLHTLESIQALGSQIYIDDFGTGYSSLSYLKKFPISAIKIDRSFVENALDSSSNANLVKAIVMMGQSLEMELVAEGIETEAQWHFLKNLGCHYAQGYLISKPLPFAAVTALLKQTLPSLLTLNDEGQYRR